MTAEPAASMVLLPDMRLYRFLCDLAFDLSASPEMLREPLFMLRAREFAALICLPTEERDAMWRRERRIAARRFTAALYQADARRENIERQRALGWAVWS